MKVLIAQPGVLDPEESLRKFSTINEKNGPFDVKILIGKSDPDFDYKEKCSDITQVMFFSPTNTELIETDDTPNIKFFSGYGIYKLANGLVIGYISCSKEQLQNDKKDIQEYFASSKEFIDILITSVGGRKTSLLTELKTPGNTIIDEIMNSKRPQYHITHGMDKTYIDMQPFTWGERSSDSQITRYYNLAAYNPNSKEKWILAFNLDAGRDFNDLNDKNLNLGPNPYLLQTKKRKGTENSATPKKQKIIDTSTCHFCFSNPNVEDHMIISIGNSAYLTVAKGPLSVARGDMNFSGHTLIIPIDHMPKLVKDSSNPTSNEIQKFEEGIARMNYCSFDMSTITFEIQSSKSIHYHKQVVPIPKFLISKFEVALDRQVHISNDKGNGVLNFQKFENSTSEDFQKIVQDKESNYLQFSVYEADHKKPIIYISRINMSEKLDLQFGRRTIAFILNLPKRIKWDSPICKQSKETELKEAQLFQKAFKNFDFTTSKDSTS